MRIVSALAIWIGILGGVWAFTEYRPKHQAAVATQPTRATGVFSVEVALTFPVEPDPFALQTDEGAEPAVVLRLTGEPLLTASTVSAGDVLVADAVDGLIVGTNAFFLEATPPSDVFPPMPSAARVRVLRDGLPIAEHVLFAEAGSPIRAEFTLTLNGHTPVGEEDDHDH